MQCLINKNVLRQALIHLNACSSSKQGKPYVTYFIMIIRTEGFLTLVANGLKQKLSIKIPVEGEFVEKKCNTHFIETQFLKNALRFFRTGEIELNAQENLVTIKQGNFIFKKYYPESLHYDFPLNDLEKPKCVLKIKAGDLFRSLSSISFCSAVDSTRHVLNGIFLDKSEFGCRAVATDGRRLAFVKLLSSFHSSNISVNVPGQAVVLLLKRLNASDPELEVCLFQEDEKLLFKWEGNELSCYMVDGKYPDYVKAIPESHSKFIVLPPLVSSIKRAELVSETVKLHISQSQLCVEACNEVDEYSESFPLEKGCEYTKLSFLNKFLRGILTHAVGEKATLGFSNYGEPVSVIGDDWQAVLMPLRGES